MAKSFTNHFLLLMKGALNMKKIICFIITAALLLTSTSVAFAKTNNAGKQVKQPTRTEQTTKQQNQKIKAKKYEFKINGSPVIKYGRYKLPISPITKGMGATVKFDKTTGVITVVKGNTTVVIDLKNKTVTVNGVADTKSGIFTAKNDKKMTVLIKYIASELGIRCDVGKDKVTVEVPGLDYPTDVAVTPVSVSGAAIVVNTLNSSTLYMTATAKIKAGQATGGKAELYVGSKLVATDSSIEATDTAVTFSTSDETPVNSELQAAVPQGGVVTVKLYNANKQSVTSTTGNPTLVVDYAAPTVTAVNSAAYSVSGSAITINVTGAGAVGDKVDVTKVSLTDTAVGKTYQLTTASTGVVSSEGTLTISLGSADQLGLAGFGGSAVLLTVAEGSLLSDAAGNVSNAFAAAQTVPVTLN
jgi:hypothetical protein